mmetsp:Transcript_85510/g.245571  ORF Transcript_85510/g.245571 Transcript_85510/m.245571 type:complete len:244 (-) Transcript_85510:1907-2638(-)
MSSALMSSVDALARASRCFCPSNCRASSMAFFAAACVEPAFSQAAFMASGAMSPPETSTSVASCAALTNSLTSFILASTSCLAIWCLRLERLALISDNFLFAVSTRSCSLARPSAPLAAEASARRLHANFFIATNVLAAPTATCAARSLASRASKALAAWAGAGHSSPVRKGASASCAACTSASASLHFASVSDRSFCTSACSVIIFSTPCAAATLPVEAATRSWSLPTSSRAEANLADTPVR